MDFLWFSLFWTDFCTLHFQTVSQFNTNSNPVCLLKDNFGWENLRSKAHQTRNVKINSNNSEKIMKMTKEYQENVKFFERNEKKTSIIQFEGW